jgi:hypothetical protein
VEAAEDEVTEFDSKQLSADQDEHLIPAFGPHKK